MEFLLYILFFITIVLVGVIIYLIYKRRKYTRERFAFYSLFLLFSMGTLFAVHVFSDNSFIIILFKILNKYFDLQLEIPYTDWTGKIWSALIYFIFASVIIFISKSWQGGKSREDIKLEDIHKEMNFLNAALKGFTSFNIQIENKKHLDIQEKASDLTFFNMSKDWHTQVKEIFIFISSQYKISEENWFSQESMYIAKYGNIDVVIMCFLKKPLLLDINKRISFSEENYPNIKFKKYIIAIQSDINENSVIDTSNHNYTIEYRFKEELLKEIVQFDEYFDFLNKEFFHKEITAGDNLKLSDTYVEQKSFLHLPEGSKKKKRKDILNTEEYILKWANNNKLGKHIALLGEYGQGKSSLSLKIANELIINSNGRIPIIIELRGKSPKNETLLDLLASWASNFNINAKAIEKLLEEGKLLIILEGFDEMDLVGDKYIRRLHFKRLVEFMRYEKSKVLITGRPNLFFDNNEMEDFLELNKDNNNLFYCNALILNQLELKQIESSLRNVNIKIKDEIMNVLRSENQNTNFKELISRPSTLYQASIIWDSLDKKNINSASIIDKFIKHSYYRQEEKFSTIGRTGMESILTIKEREYFTLGIAVSIIKKDSYSNQISNYQLRDTISNLYINIPDDVSNDHVNAILLKKRLEDDPYKIETIFNDVRASGIIVKDLIKNNYFKFAHKSFLEYLFAFYFTHYKYQNKIYYTKVVNCITNSLKIQNIYNIKLTDEIIQFISELLLEHDNLKTSDSILARKLLKIILPNKVFNFFPKIFVNKYFRYLNNTIISILISVSFFHFINYDHTKLSGVYILVSLLLCIPFYYLKEITDLNKISQPLKIWYKTCSVKVSYSSIHSVICEKSIESILDDSYLSKTKELSKLFNDIKIKEIKNIIKNDDK